MLKINRPPFFILIIIKKTFNTLLHTLTISADLHNEILENVFKCFSSVRDEK